MKWNWGKFDWMSLKISNLWKKSRRYLTCLMNPQVVLGNLVLYSSIIDFNECSVRNGLCQQRCINAFGSYRYHKSVILNKKKSSEHIFCPRKTKFNYKANALWALSYFWTLPHLLFSALIGQPSILKLLNLFCRCECANGYVRALGNPRRCVDLDECEMVRNVRGSNFMLWFYARNSQQV